MKEGSLRKHGETSAGDEAAARPPVLTEGTLAQLALEPLLDDLLLRIRGALGADTVVLLLADPGEDELHAAAVLDFDEEIADRVRVPIGRGFAGTIAATGKPIAIEDLDSADIVNELLRKRGLRSMLGVPVMLDGDVIGVLHVGSLVRRRFTDAETELLAGIAERLAFAIGKARAHEAERRAHERLVVLAEASHILSSSLEYETTLAQIGRLAVPRLADWYSVTLLEGDRLVTVAIAHEDPAKVEWAREFLRRYPPALDEPTGVAKVVRTGESELVPEVTDEMLVAAARDEEYLELLRHVGFSSTMLVPLRSGDAVLGCLAFMAAESERRFSEDDLRLAEELGRRVAVAIENARLHRAEHQARARAELLQAVTAHLATARTQREVADVLVTEGVTALGAAAGWVALLAPDGRDLETVAAVGYPEAILERYRRIPVEGAIGAQAILEHGRSTWLSSADEVVSEYPHHADAYRSMGFEALAVVPLEVGGKPAGFVALNFAAPTAFGVSERALLLAVAGQCSQAFERAQLYDELSERANAAFVLAHVDDGVFQVDADGVVRYWNPAAEHLTGICAVEALGTPVAELLGGWEAATATIDVAAQPGVAGGRDAVPLEVRGEERWLALSGVRNPDGTVYAFRDLTADRALEQARRDFLATASHELRTPLGAVYGAALTLLNLELDEGQHAAMLEMIVRESERLKRIVEDLLLANNLDLDHVRMDFAVADAVELAREVVSLRNGTLPEGFTLSVAANGREIAVACDPERLRQVLVNLVDNAIKYSPSGGDVRIEIGVEKRTVRFVVSDEGIGIPAGEQERIFEKFYRLDPHLRRGVGGSGLGLYISRELVRRMDGRIMVESEPGRGSRFVVELPRAPG